MDIPVVSGPIGGTRDDFDEWVRPHLSVMRRLAVVAAIGHDPDDLMRCAAARSNPPCPTRGRPSPLL